MAVLLDTGPWVALLSRNDTHHRWVVKQFRRLSPPLLSCEAVVVETCFLLLRSGFDPALALQFIERGVVQLPFTLQEQINDSPLLLTSDCDFHIYRRHGRQTIPQISP